MNTQTLDLCDFASLIEIWYVMTPVYLVYLCYADSLTCLKTFSHIHYPQVGRRSAPHSTADRRPLDLGAQLGAPLFDDDDGQALALGVSLARPSNYVPISYCSSNRS